MRAQRLMAQGANSMSSIETSFKDYESQMRAASYNRAYRGGTSRRDFLKLAAATGSLRLLPSTGFASICPDERTDWYRKAKFGMFIHWGPYSLASVEASWPIMTPKRGGISEEEYVRLSKRFNPERFDAHAIVDLARLAGQQYVVFTTKHHDGFCMFDSSYTNYKITNTPYGKDIVQQLSTACERAGMPLGYYYSPPDMHHPAFRDTSRPASTNWHGEPMRPEWPLYLQYMQLQLTELLTRYGPVALIWFDGLNDQQKYDGKHVLELIRRLQPAALVNDRIGIPGDYETPEQFIPESIPIKNVNLNAMDRSASEKLRFTVPPPEQFQLWETCMTINNTWAYNSNDRDFKSTQFLIKALVEVASRGGNFLLNVGPRPDGTIQTEFQERLRSMGNWLAANGDSIYGTTYGPVQGVDSVRTTSKENLIFVHVFDWPSGALEIRGIRARVLSARLLASSQGLKFTQNDGIFRLNLPAQMPDANVTTIALVTS